MILQQISQMRLFSWRTMQILKNYFIFAFFTCICQASECGATVSSNFYKLNQNATI